MKKVGLAYDDIFLAHCPPSWHPDSPQRIQAVLEALRSSGIVRTLVPLQPRRAAYEDLVRVHTPEHIENMLRLQPGEVDPDTYASEGTIEAALFAAGAVMEAVTQCRSGSIDRAFCLVRPPGHHAEADRAMGFCFFNNVAIGARHARSLGYEKIFIVDFDAHHGNGTQHIFEEDETALYFSTHQHPYYPETGKDSERGTGKGYGFTYNFPIPAGSGNRDYLSVYQDILPGLILRFGPDLVLVSAGYDIHRDDLHANIRVSDEGVRAIVRSILRSSDCPSIFVLEGGYDHLSLARSVLITLEEMAKDDF